MATPLAQAFATVQGMHTYVPKTPYNMRTAGACQFASCHSGNLLDCNPNKLSCVNMDGFFASAPNDAQPIIESFFGQGSQYEGPVKKRNCSK